MPKPATADPQALQFAHRLRNTRTSTGITQAQAAKAANVTTNTFASWERAATTPKCWRLGDIARALDVPPGALLSDDAVIAEVTVSRDTLIAVRADSSAADAAAERIAEALKPLIRRAATAPAVVSAGRRRSRAQVLAGARAAQEAVRDRRASELVGSAVAAD